MSTLRSGNLGRLVMLVESAAVALSIGCSSDSADCQPGREVCEGGHLIYCTADAKAVTVPGCGCSVMGGGLFVACFSNGGASGAGSSGAPGASATGGAGVCSRANQASITNFDNLGGDAGNYYGTTDDGVGLALTFVDADATATKALVESPGANGSAFAAHLAWPDAVAGGSMQLSLAECFDASQWRGLSWSSMGTGQLTASVLTATATHGYSFSPPSATSWAVQSATWADFVDATSQSSLDPHDIGTVRFATSAPGPIDVWIDELTWY